jgi:hypothetical protein
MRNENHCADQEGSRGLVHGRKPDHGQLLSRTCIAAWTGAQSLLELLNAPRRFLPLETENGELLLVQKNGLVLARSNQCILVQRSPHAKDIPVSVELLTGDSMDGTISHDLPESYPRISDFLNFSPQFFALRIDGWDCLLNSESVRSVRPVKEDQGDAVTSAAAPFRSSP